MLQKDMLEQLHQRLFGQPMSAAMRHFLVNLRTSFLSSAIASGTMMVITIIVGRNIGPENYGIYALTLTWAQLLTIPLLFGLDIATIRSVAQADTTHKATYATAALFFVTTTSVTLLLLTVLFQPFVARFIPFGISLWLLVFLALALTLKGLSDSIMQGLQAFREQLVARLADVGVTTLLVVLLINQSRLTPHTYITTLIIGTLAFLMIASLKIRRYITEFAWSSLTQELAYGKLLMAGTIAGTAFLSLDRFIVAKYLSLYELGIYSAYFGASTNLVAQLVQMFINVFFPSIAASGTTYPMLSKINHLSRIIIIPLATVLGCALWVIITFFGKAFDLRASYILLFSLIGALQFIFTVYAYFITAASQQLYRKYLVWLTGLDVVHLGVYAILITQNMLTIQTIGIVFLTSMSIKIMVQITLLKSHFAATRAH